MSDESVIERPADIEARRGMVNDMSDVVANADEILYLMRWWLVKTPKRKRLAMACGGVSDVVHEAFLSMLRSPPKEGWMLSTTACNAVRWTLAKMCGEICQIELIGLYPKVYSSIDVVAEYEEQEKREVAWSTVDTLPKRISDVVQRRMNGESLEDIGRVWRITRERVRQLELKGIRMLQHDHRADRLKVFM